MNKKVHNMKISVAICTYNRPELLKKCMRSIIKQDLPPFELIIVYHSKNDLRKVSMLKRGVGVRFLHCNKTNSAVARNMAINSSKGTILAFIDDDCIANKNWLQCITQQFEDQRCQIVMGKAVNGSRSNIFSIIENARINYYVESNIITKDKKKHAFVLDTKNFAIRKSLLVGHNLLFDTRFTNKFEDIDFGLRTISIGVSILYNPRIIVRHFGTSSLLSHVKREFSIGYNYCVMKAKWTHKLNMKIAQRLYHTRTKINFPPKSYILLEWVDILFRFFGCLWYRFEKRF